MCVVCIYMYMYLQVRVFIQSATGQIHEETADDKDIDVGDTPISCHHNDTTTRSVAMDMTLVEGVPTDPCNAITTDQVCLLYS